MVNNGCTEYVKGTVELFFEPDHVDCSHCQLMTTYSRNQCMRTGELIVDPRGRGRWCPINFGGDEKYQSMDYEGEKK